MSVLGDTLEANAEEYWQAPRLQVGGGMAGSALLEDDIPFGDSLDDDDDEFDPELEEAALTRGEKGEE